MKKYLREILRYSLIAAMIFTIAFAFFQSAKTSEKSLETSEKVEQIIEPILPADTPVGGYVQTNIRKIAHFVEFFALGCEVAIYVLVFAPKIKFALYSLGVALVVALADETIQIFSDRGSSVADVWLDFAGFFAAALIIYAIGFSIFYVLRRRSGSASGINSNGDV